MNPPGLLTILRLRLLDSPDLADETLPGDSILYDPMISNILDSLSIPENFFNETLAAESPAAIEQPPVIFNVSSNDHSWLLDMCTAPLRIEKQ